LTTGLFADTLPIQTNTRSIITNKQKTAEKMEADLGEEMFLFARVCPAESVALPETDGRMTLGLDGAYVRAREGHNRKAGWFEVIAGKPVTQDEGAK
jgi:hypothetical protein